MLPAEGLSDLYGLAGWILPGTAVKSERTARLRDVHDDLLVPNSGSCSGRHLCVDGRLGTCPDLEYTIITHATHRVVRFHRGVREVGQLVDRVYDVRRVCESCRDVSSVCSYNGVFSGFDESAMFLKELVRAAALGVVIVPDDVEQTDA